MLTLYHGANSVCSIKVRLVLHEKQLDWTGRHIDLPKGEQFSEKFLKIAKKLFLPFFKGSAAAAVALQI